MLSALCAHASFQTQHVRPLHTSPTWHEVNTMSLVQYLVCDACEFQFGPVGVKPHQPAAQRQQLFVLCNQCRNAMVIDDIPGQITTPCGVCGARDFSALNQCPVCANPDVHWRGQDELAVG